jgi:hypothetical protein
MMPKAYFVILIAWHWRLNMAKRKPPESIKGGYAGMPWAVLDSLAFRGSTDRAKSLLFAVIRQHNGSNNGRYQLTDAWLAKQGYPSKELNSKAQKELIERGLIIKTKHGGLNIGCNFFAVTWLPISNFVGLDITAGDYQQGAYGRCELSATARRKPPINCDMPPDKRGSTTPTTGTGDGLATPTSGAKKAILGAITTPLIGNNVLPPLHSKKAVTGKQRIVGKAGRSGIPKNRQPEQVQ